MATTTQTTEPRLSQHPISAAFPAMGDAEFASLVNNIKVNGQKLPITVYDDQVLDGWHRYQACQQLRIAPKLEDFAGGDPVSFVLSLNLERRHLTDSQRAMVAAKLANLDHGGDRKRAIKSPHGDLKVTQAEAATRLKVKKRSVERAKAVLKHGTPALVNDVETGKVPVATAAKQVKAPSQHHATTKSSAAPKPAIEPKPTVQNPPQAPTTDADPRRALVAVLARVRDAFAAESLGGIPRGNQLTAVLEGFRQLYGWESRWTFASILEDDARRVRKLTKKTWNAPVGA
jgi:hypothetical protein